MHPSRVPNLLLKIVKWPVALASLASLFFLLPALNESPLAKLSIADLHWLAWGAGGYLVAWQLIFRRRFAGSYFSTFEHELTHAIFAWATLHRVTGLTVTWQNGGECRFEGSGGGNWLISIAPYWFPTLVWPPLLLTYALEERYHPALDVALGVAIASVVVGGAGAGAGSTRYPARPSFMLSCGTPSRGIGALPPLYRSPCM